MVYTQRQRCHSLLFSLSARHEWITSGAGERKEVQVGVTVEVSWAQCELERVGFAPWQVAAVSLSRRPPTAHTHKKVIFRIMSIIYSSCLPRVIIRQPPVLPPTQCDISTVSAHTVFQTWQTAGGWKHLSKLHNWYLCNCLARNSSMCLPCSFFFSVQLQDV